LVKFSDFVKVFKSCFHFNSVFSFNISIHWLATNVSNFVQTVSCPLSLPLSKFMSFKHFLKNVNTNVGMFFLLFCPISFVSISRIWPFAFNHQWCWSNFKDWFFDLFRASKLYFIRIPFLIDIKEEILYSNWKIWCEKCFSYLKTMIT
jgi:hypothetical protein